MVLFKKICIKNASLKLKPRPAKCVIAVKGFTQNSRGPGVRLGLLREDPLDGGDRKDVMASASGWEEGSKRNLEEQR